MSGVVVPGTPKPPRLWLDSRKLKALAAEPKKQKVQWKVPPKPARDSARLKPLSAPAKRAIQNLWNQYAAETPGAEFANTRAQTLGQMELVGAHLTVVKATNPTNLMLSGVVIDESEHMVYLQSDREARVLQVAKQGTHFEVNMNGKPMVLLGQGIDRTVASRTKAKRKKITSMLD